MKLSMLTENISDKDWDIYIEDDVLYIIYNTETLTIDKAKAVIEQRLKLCNGKTYPLITDLRKIKNSDNEIMKYFARPESMFYLSAGAFITKSLFQETAGNLFILLYKPPIPTRLFRDKKDALKWISQFKNY